MRLPAPGTVLADLAGGTVTALVAVAYGLSFAVMIFSAPLDGDLSYGIAATLISSGVGAIVVGLGSSYRFSVAGPYAATMAVTSAMVAKVATEVAISGDPATLHVQVLFVVVLATGVTGFVLMVVGVLRLGVWLRYIPYPVVGGFLATAGWLLASGAVTIATGHPVRLETLPRLAEPDALGHLAAAAAFAGALFVARGRIRHPLVLPVLLVLGVLASHAALAAAGIGAADARARQWLLPHVDDFRTWWPWSRQVLEQVEWPLLWRHAGEIAAAAGVTAISILLGVTGIEISHRNSVDLDREFRANGIANLVVGLFAGVIANVSVNRSQLLVAAGGRSRASVAVSGGVCLVVLFAGTDLIGLLPTPILAGLLLYLGVSVLWEWLIRARARLSWTDSLLVIAIAVIIVVHGYVQGIGLGVVASCILFALSYSRARVIKHHLSRQEYGSYVDRSYEQARVLRDHGEEIQILWLQGYLFFGTANRLLEEIKGSVETPPIRPVRYVVLDFHLVSGIDSSALFSFIKLRNFAERHRVRLIFCALPAAIRDALKAEGLLTAAGPVAMAFANLDSALEWAEERVLEERFSGGDGLPAFEAWLGSMLLGEDVTIRFLRFLDVVELEPGDALFRQGDPADALYFVVSGRLDVMFEEPLEPAIRLRSITGYNVVGEMGLYRDVPRSASVIAAAPSLLMRLGRDAFVAMQTSDPQVCNAFHAFIVRTLADRIGFATKEIAALQR